MAGETLEAKVVRFEGNEQRFNTLVNGGPDDTWSSTGGTELPSVQKFFADTEALYDNAVLVADHAEMVDRLPTIPNGSVVEVQKDETLGDSRTRYKVSMGVATFLVNVDRWVDVVKRASLIYANYAAASAAAATLPDGQSFIVEVDETKDGKRTRYKKKAGALYYNGLAYTAESTSFQITPVALATRTVADRLGEIVSVKDFGAIGDGYYHPLSERFSTLAMAQVAYPHATSLTQSIDWAAIQGAVDWLHNRVIEDDIAGQGNSMGGGVFCPFGTYRVTDPLIVRGRVSLVGFGRRSSMIAVATGFPANSHVIQLGELVEGAVFDCSVKSLTVNTNLRADLIGIVSAQASEGCEIEDVLIRGTYRCVRFYRSGAPSGSNPNSPTETKIQDCEFWLEGGGGPAAPRHAIEYANCSQSNVIRHVTVYDLNSASGVGSSAVKITSSSVDIDHLHLEKMENGVIIEGSEVRANIKNVEGFSVKNLVVVEDGVTAHQLLAENLFNNVPTGQTANGIVDKPNSVTLSGATVCKVSSYIRRSSSNVHTRHHLSTLSVGDTSSSLSSIRKRAIQFEFGSLAPGGRQTVTQSVAGVPVGSVLLGHPRLQTNQPNLGAGTLVAYTYGVTAADTIAITATNNGTATATPGVVTFDLIAFSS